MVDGARLLHVPSLSSSRLVISGCGSSSQRDRSGVRPHPCRVSVCHRRRNVLSGDEEVNPLDTGDGARRQGLHDVSVCGGVVRRVRV